MGRRRRGERCLGPYRHARGWQVRVIPAPDAGGPSRPSYHYFATEEEGRRFRVRVEADIVRAATSIDEALTEYHKHHIAKGNKPGSTKETMRRLRKFFQAVGLPLDLLTQRTCASYYQRLIDAGLAADSHRNYLAESRSFLSWVVAKKWLPRNPLDGVKGEGKRKSGKVQLRIDEAKAWDKVALARARAGDDQALAALMTLWLGLRCSEVTHLQVRDIDDGGRLLWVADSKTDTGRRTTEVPAPLRPLLAKLTKDRGHTDWLFVGPKGKRDRAWPRFGVKDICAAAKVPIVVAHAMRGLHGTLSVARGMSGHAVAAALGHRSFKTTEKSYAKRESVADAAHRQTLKVLTGGRK